VKGDMCEEKPFGYGVNGEYLEVNFLVNAFDMAIFNFSN
jgi:hypothetical protein